MRNTRLSFFFFLLFILDMQTTYMSLSFYSSHLEEKNPFMILIFDAIGMRPTFILSIFIVLSVLIGLNVLSSINDRITDVIRWTLFVFIGHRAIIVMNNIYFLIIILLRLTRWSQ